MIYIIIWFTVGGYLGLVCAHSVVQEDIEKYRGKYDFTNVVTYLFFIFVMSLFGILSMFWVWRVSWDWKIKWNIFKWRK